MPQIPEKEELIMSQGTGVLETFLDVDVIARQIGVDMKEVMGWADTGEFPVYRFPGDILRVSQADIGQWLASKKVVGGVVPPNNPAITVIREKGKHRTGQAKAIGARLHMLRTLSGLSQPFLAGRFDIDKWKKLDRYERGEIVFDDKLLDSIAAYFSVRKEWLAIGSGPIKSDNVTFFKIGHKPILSQNRYIYEKAIATYLPQLACKFDQSCIFSVENATFVLNEKHKNGISVSGLWEAKTATVLVMGSTAGEYIVLITNYEALAIKMAKTMQNINNIGFVNSGKKKVAAVPPCILNCGGNGSMVSALKSFLDNSH